MGRNLYFAKNFSSKIFDIVSIGGRLDSMYQNRLLAFRIIVELSDH